MINQPCPGCGVIGAGCICSIVRPDEAPPQDGLFTKHSTFEAEAKARAAAMAEAQATIDKLRARAEALEAALSDFVAMGDQYEWEQTRTGRAILMRQARAALQHQEGE